MYELLGIGLGVVMSIFIAHAVITEPGPPPGYIPIIK